MTPTLFIVQPPPPLPPASRAPPIPRLPSQRCRCTLQRSGRARLGAPSSDETLLVGKEVLRVNDPVAIGAGKIIFPPHTHIVAC